MNKNRFYLCQFPALFLVASLWLAPSPAARAQTLYNAYLGTPPQSQGWSFIPEGTYYETVTDNSVLLDTTTTGVTEAGWGEITASDLNHTNGFSLLFGAMLNSETHTSTNRAGFSLIVLRDDTNGIELAFWTNEIFAQSDSPLFTQAESASFTTTGSFVNYTLTMLAQSRRAGAKLHRLFRLSRPLQHAGFHLLRRRHHLWRRLGSGAGDDVAAAAQFDDAGSGNCGVDGRKQPDLYRPSQHEFKNMEHGRGSRLLQQFVLIYQRLLRLQSVLSSRVALSSMY
jgi:hypothetical protein